MPGLRGLKEGTLVRISVMPTSAKVTTAATRSRRSCSTWTTTGYATAAGDGEVPAGMEDKARLAAANCPEYAVLIEE